MIEISEKEITMEAIFRIGLGVMMLAAIVELFVPELFSWSPFYGSPVVLSGLLVLIIIIVWEISKAAKGLLDDVGKK